MERLEEKLNKHIDLLVQRYPSLEQCKESIIQAYQLIASAYENGAKLLIAGNGGSASDSEHIAGELMKSFRLPRPVSKELASKLKSIDSSRGEYLAQHLEMPLTAIPLVAHEALSTAYSNDVDAEGVFAQQLLGFARPKDVFLAISTSGNSKNIMNAAVLAKALDMQIIGLTGKKDSELSAIADVTIQVPETETYMVQELHLPIYHCLCLMLEERFFS
jgi:D-sedoheptulose 7-phosphate isomerase